MAYPTEPTGRIDTTITQVEVRGTEGWTHRRAAERHVEDNFPGAKILAVWPSDVRGPHGSRVWCVEWEGDAE